MNVANVYKLSTKKIVIGPVNGVRHWSWVANVANGYEPSMTNNDSHFTCTSGRCNRQSEFTVAFYDISVILRSAAALYRQ